MRASDSASRAARPAVASLDAARLKRMLADRHARARRLAEDDQRIAAFCRRWGDAHGYSVLLRPEQVLRAIEAEGA